MTNVTLQSKLENLAFTKPLNECQRLHLCSKKGFYAFLTANKIHLQEYYNKMQDTFT